MTTRTKVCFNKPHIHSGVEYAPGDEVEIELRGDEIAWLESLGVITVISTIILENGNGNPSD